MEIVYCSRCGAMIPPGGVDDGKYFEIDDQPVCLECFHGAVKARDQDREPPPIRFGVPRADAAAAPESVPAARQVPARRPAAGGLSKAGPAVAAGLLIAGAVLGGVLLIRRSPSGSGPVRSRPDSGDDSRKSPGTPLPSARGLEQVSWRWADARRRPLAAENAAVTVRKGQNLHLRVGVRCGPDAGRPFRLGLECAGRADFSDAHPVAGSSGDLSFWNDGDCESNERLTGDLLLAGLPERGRCHEALKGPGYARPPGALCEEDFAVRPTARGTWYLRVVTITDRGPADRLATRGPPIRLEVK